MTLEQKLKGIVKKINARKFKVEANVDDVSHYVDACINIQNWKINVTVDSNIEESLQQIPQGLIPGKNLLDDLLYAVSFHELGHNQNPEGFFGCPGDEEYFKKIVEGIRDALEELDVADGRKDQLVPEVANLFEDYIVNCSYALKDKERGSFRNGMSSFYFLNSLHRSENGQCEQQGFQQLFGQFVDLQLKTFWREGEIREYASGITRDYSGELARDLFHIFSDSEELADKLMNNDLSRDEELDYYGELNDKEKWNLKAYEFTKRIYDLLDNQQQPDPNQYDQGQGQGQGQQQGQSQGQQGDGQQGQGQQQCQPQGQQGDGQQGQGQQESATGGISGGAFKPSGEYFTQKYEKDKKFRNKINEEVDHRSKSDSFGDDTSDYGEDNFGEGNEIELPETLQDNRIDPLEDLSKDNPGKGRGNPSGAFGPGPEDYINKYKVNRDGFKGIPPFLQPHVCDHGLPGTMGEAKVELQFSQIDQLYKKLAGKLKVPVRPSDEPTVSEFVIGHASKTELNEFGIGASLDGIAWGSTIALPTGEFQFYQHQAPITVKEEVTPQPLTFDRDVLFIGDVSASMGYSLVGDRERFRKKDSGIQGYDCFCILARSFVDTVKELGVVGVNYGAFLFGNHSRFSGWSEDEKKILNYIYNGYGDACIENLEIKKFLGLFKQHGRENPDKRILTVMLSDGYIRNHDRALAAADHLIERGHEFVYIQYNGADYSDVGYNDSEAQNKMRSFAQGLLERGQQVFQIKTYKNLFEIDLDLGLS